MENKKVQLNLYIPEEVRDALQRIAAEKMLKDPHRVISASKVGAEILINYLKDKTQKGKSREDKENGLL